MVLSLCSIHGWIFGRQCRSIRPKIQLNSIRIKIHGTKNAFTTLQNNDVVLYRLQEPTNNDKQNALAAYFSTDNIIVPLCKKEIDSIEYYPQPHVPYLSAAKLNEKGSLLRVISSNKVGDSYCVEEYIDSDVHVPLFEDIIAADVTSGMSDHLGANLKLSLLQAEAAVANLRLQLATSQSLQDGLCSGVTLQAIESPGAPRPGGAYSQAVAANGMIFVSGCIAIACDHTGLVSTDVAEQTKQCLTNLKAVLESAGSSVASICKTTLFLANIEDIAIVNGIYAGFLTENNVIVLPARSTIGVAALPLGALIEIEAVALK